MEKITIEALVQAPLAKAWELYSSPEAIMQWNQASDDWHTTKASLDLRPGGTFNHRMEARDGSAGFDFSGTYTEVVPQSRVAYTMGDGRTAEVTFAEEAGGTRIVVRFDPESENTPEFQRAGWQAILDSFKRYAESQKAPSAVRPFTYRGQVGRGMLIGVAMWALSIPGLSPIAPFWSLHLLSLRVAEKYTGHAYSRPDSFIPVFDVPGVAISLGIIVVLYTMLQIALARQNRVLRYLVMFAFFPLLLWALLSQI